MSKELLQLGDNRNTAPSQSDSDCTSRIMVQEVFTDLGANSGGQKRLDAADEQRPATTVPMHREAAPATNQDWNEHNRNQTSSERVERTPQELSPRPTNTPSIDTTKDAPKTSKDLTAEELAAVRARLIEGLPKEAQEAIAKQKEKNDAIAKEKIKNDAQKICRALGFGDCTLEFLTP